MTQRKPQKDLYGPYDLTFTQRDLLQKFASCVWREHCHGIPIPRKLDGYSFHDQHSKLWWKFYKEYQEGRVAYEFDVDRESMPLVDLTRLSIKFSKEV